MGFYRISSQLTDYILSSSTPGAADKYFEQIKAALQQLADLGVIGPIEALRTGTFQANPKETMTDEQMLENLKGDPDKRAQEVNQMYLVLNQLTRTGQLSSRARNLLERFMTNVWQPLDEGEVESEQEGQLRPGVVKGRRKSEPTHVPEIDEKTNVPRWMQTEERMIEDISRIRGEASKTYDLLVTAGVLEIIPDFEERKQRLAERKYSWAIFS